jgi:hypothetical protein
VTAFAVLLQREVIIALALVGAVVATIGSVLVHREKTAPPPHVRLVLQFGYALTFFSVGLFIVAGFVGVDGN